MGLLTALSSTGRSKFDSMNLLLTGHPISALNRRCTCFKMPSTPKRNCDKSRTKLTSSRRFMERALATIPTVTYCCQLHQTLMPGMHQRAEQAPPREVSMLMTLATSRMTNSMMPTTWIVTLWNSKPMSTSNNPRIPGLPETEHCRIHVLLCFLKRDLHQAMSVEPAMASPATRGMRNLGYTV